MEFNQNAVPSAVGWKERYIVVGMASLRNVSCELRTDVRIYAELAFIV